MHCLPPACDPALPPTTISPSPAREEGEGRRRGGAGWAGNCFICSIPTFPIKEGRKEGGGGEADPSS